MADSRSEDAEISPLFARLNPLESGILNLQSGIPDGL
jgi:hypothetical protein